MMTRKNAIIASILMLIAITANGFLFFFLKRGRVLKETRYYSDIASEIAEIIIPRTDTPGAKDARVSAYIINLIESCLSLRDKKAILAGLDDVEVYCIKKYSLSFKRCTQEKKIAVLEYFQKKGIFENAFLNKVKSKLIGPSFFELIKDLTVRAYCTSRIGATQGLAYEHIPINYIACKSLVTNQRSWATA